MRKHTRRKHWNLVDPIAHAIAGAAITTKEHLDKLMLLELSSLDAMTHGRAGTSDWKDLTDVLNLCETMAKGGIGPEALPYCEVAEEALKQAAYRYQQTMKMGLSGTGLTAMKHLLEYHQLQRISISRSEYERWIQKTRNKILSKAKDVVEI